jgi:hypothetical protein
MRRHAIGIIALLLLVGNVVLRVWPLPDETWQVWMLSACARLGPVLALLWFAFDEVERLPAWVLPLILAVLVALALRPKLFLIAVPVIVALAILRPRFGRKR